MLREMPYVEGMVAELLRDRLAGAAPDLMVTTEMPDVDVRTYPLVLLVNANTGFEHDGRLARTTLDVQVWSKESRREAAGLGEMIRLVLRDARRSQTRLVDPLGDAYTTGYGGQDGHLVGSEVTSSGFLPSGDTVAPWRYQVLVSLAVRPSA